MNRLIDGSTLVVYVVSIESVDVQRKIALRSNMLPELLFLENFARDYTMFCFTFNTF